LARRRLIERQPTTRDPEASGRERRHVRGRGRGRGRGGGGAGGSGGGPRRWQASPAPGA
jgi:hypothetical protein